MSRHPKREAADELERAANLVLAHVEQVIDDVTALKRVARALRDEADAEQEAAAALDWIGPDVRVRRERRAG